MPYVYQFTVHPPTYVIEQADFIETWLGQESTHPALKRYACKPPAICTRGSFVDPFTNPEGPDFARQGIEAKGELFQACVQQALPHIYAKRLAPEHLMHVTCTGYVAPSAPQVFVGERSWPTQVSHAYHMGCYAAIPALRLMGNAPGDVLHTELCSLHFDPKSSTPESVVIQSLFADGMIAYRVSEADDLRGYRGPALEILRVHETVIPGTQHAMTWRVGSQRFDMTLDRNVPDIVARHVGPEVHRLVSPWASSLQGIHVAIHPGGPRIIAQVAKALELAPHQYTASEKVLKERGNMSSATLPHMWDEITRDPQIPEGTLVLSLAFGPGLTLAATLMRKVRL